MRTPIRIREATPDDVADIVTLIAHLGYPVREEALERTLELLRQTPGHAVLVAERYGEVCGLLVLSAHPSLTLQGGLGVVQELVVRPTRRRREIGESLLQYAKGLAVERGFARLECSVPTPHQPTAEHFLLERGFEIVEGTTYRWSVLEGKYPRLLRGPGAACARRRRGRAGGAASRRRSLGGAGARGPRRSSRPPGSGPAAAVRARAGGVAHRASRRRETLPLDRRSALRRAPVAGVRPLARRPGGGPRPRRAAGPRDPALVRRRRPHSPLGRRGQDRRRGLPATRRVSPLIERWLGPQSWPAAAGIA